MGVLRVKGEKKEFRLAITLKNVFPRNRFPATDELLFHMKRFFMHAPWCIIPNVIRRIYNF